MKIKKLLKPLIQTLVLTVFAAGALHTVAQNYQQGQNQMGNMQMNMPYDLHYIDMMSMHHRQGIDMLNLAVSKSRNAGVKALARKGAADQERDIETLKQYRDQFYPGQPEMKMEDMMGGMSGMANMQGMDMKTTKGMNMHTDMKTTTDKLRAASGKDFDRQFLDAMISHHQMAREMSKEAMIKGEPVEIKNFARTVSAKQWAEIAQMNKLKASLGGTSRKAPARKRANTMKGHDMPGMKMP